ncbi:oligosaccharide flippase family protein [Noviherbaspirillum malthae]|uniref:oligosaccharide flippase family protein n=1 Tax=Noviherbaspirillum malthae TaxID=1260987 RepID=UPI0018908978|nr:oligosaccharide flippase family protein [Noviherbaspirillum malthae]
MPFSIQWLYRVQQQISVAPLYRRIINGAVWSLLGVLISRCFTFATTIFIARILGADGYGEIGMVQSTIGFFAVFAGFGLGSTATKFVAQHRQADQEKTGRIIVLVVVVGALFSSVLSLACAASASLVSTFVLHRPELKLILNAGAIFLFISVMGGIMTAVLTGFEAFKTIAAINVAQAIITPLVSIPLVVAFGTVGAISAMTVIAAIGLVLSSSCVKKHCLTCGIPIKYVSQIWQERAILFSFSLPSMMSALMMAPAVWITNSVLVAQEGGYTEFGIFTAANQWRNLLLIIPTILSSAILPILSQAHGTHDTLSFKRIVSFNIHLTWLISLPLTVVMALFSPVFGALFGETFDGVDPLISVLMIVCFLGLVNGAVGSSFAGSGRMWIGTAMNFVWAIVLIVTTYLMVPLYGGMGLALSYLISYTTHTVWQLIYLELRIAEGAITNHWTLIISTIFLLGMCLTIGMLKYNNNLTKIGLSIASFLPIGIFCIDKILFNRVKQEVRRV